MKKLLTVLVLLSISSISSASEWLYLFSSDTKNTMLILKVLSGSTAIMRT